MTNVNVVEKVAVISDFVHRLRKKHGIVAGSHARGIESNEYGEIEGFLYDELVRSPDDTGGWNRLVEGEFLDKVYGFVGARIAP